MTTINNSNKTRQPATNVGISQSVTSPLASHGRGGAGNMANASQSPKLTPSDLETPVLKKPVVTTGRGGTGNMAKNEDPYETRRRQDVNAIPRRNSASAQHAGRGGAGNVFKSSEADLELGLNRSQEQAHNNGPGPESRTAKGKNWLFSKT